MNKPFQSVYKTLKASQVVLFLILLKGFQPLYNVIRSSVWIVVGVSYLPLHFIMSVIIIIIIITFIVNIIFIICIITRIFIKNYYYRFYELSLVFGFVSFYYLICLKLIHVNTNWG